MMLAALDFPVRPYRTVARALQSAARGDTVRLLAGDYPEPMGVTVPHGVHILGTEPTTLSGGMRSGVPGVTLLGDAVLADLQVRRFSSGVVAVSLLDPPALVELRSVDAMESFEGHGVVLGGNVHARVQPSGSGHVPVMAGNTASGMWLNQDAVVVLSRAHTTGNHQNGIALSERAQLTADNLVSTDNGLLQNAFTAFGIQLADGTALSLTNSTLGHNVGAGVLTTPTFNGTLSITGCTISGNGVLNVQQAEAGGVVLGSLTGGVVTVDSTSLQGNHMGIQILDASSVVLRNTDIGGSLSRGINISQNGVMEVLLDAVRVHDNLGDGLGVDDCGPERSVRVINQTVLERNAHGAAVSCGTFTCDNALFQQNNLNGLYGLGAAVLSLNRCRVNGNGVRAAAHGSGVELEDAVQFSMTRGTASDNGKSGVQGGTGFRGRMSLARVTVSGNGSAGGTTVAGVDIGGGTSTVLLDDITANGNAVGLAIRGQPTFTATGCTFNNNTLEGVFIQSTGAYSATFTYTEILENGRAGMVLAGTTAGAPSATLRMQNASLVDNGLQDTTGAAGLTFAGNQLLDARFKDLLVLSGRGDGIRVENVRATVFLGDEANLCPNPLVGCPDAVSVGPSDVRGTAAHDPLHADLHDARPYDATNLRPITLSNARFGTRLPMRGGHVYGGSASDPAPVRALESVLMTDPFRDAILVDDSRNSIISW
jgi:hypothetical protein